MTDFEVVTNLGGIIFLAFTVFAEAYWIESTRQEDLLSKTSKANNERLKTVLSKYRDTAELLFRLSTAGALFALALVISSLYLDSPEVGKICKYLLLIPLFGIFMVGIRYIAGRYFVPIKMPKFDK